VPGIDWSTLLIAGLYIAACGCEVRGVLLAAAVLFPEDRPPLSPQPPLWSLEQQQFEVHMQKAESEKVGALERAIRDLQGWLRILTGMVLEDRVLDSEGAHQQRVFARQMGVRAAEWIIAGAVLSLVASLTWLLR
jgi:hypothetical protein